MIRFRGEEMWIGDDHIANLRLNSDGKPFAVQTLDGEVVYTAISRRAAELWVHVHATRLMQGASSFRERDTRNAASGRVGA